MKKLSLASLVIAFLFLLSYPMGPVIHSTSAHECLTCYCCSGMDRACVMFVCQKCNHEVGSDQFEELEDALLSLFDLIISFPPLYHAAGRDIVPETFFYEAPYKPPKS